MKSCKSLRNTHNSAIFRNRRVLQRLAKRFTICLFCKRPFFASRSSNTFCSKKCTNRSYRQILPTKHCQVCNLLFHPMKRITRYCSIKCQGKGNRLSHQKTIKIYRKSYYLRNYGHWRKRTRLLSDWYIKRLLVGHSNVGLSSKDFPPEIVEIKRQQIRLLRAIRKPKLHDDNARSATDAVRRD